MNIERVVWMDSNGLARWYTKAEVLHLLPVATCTTVGFIMHETDDALWLALSYDHQDGDERHFDHVTVIPKLAITVREVLSADAL